MNMLRHVLLYCLFLLAVSARAQISQAAEFYGKIGNTDFNVGVSNDGASVSFYYLSAGVEQGTGRVGANNTATFTTDRNRQVTVRIQGDTVTGSFLNQAFSATRESEVGPLSGISGKYSGTFFEAANGSSGTSSPMILGVFPSARVNGAIVNTTNNQVAYFVGTMSPTGALTLSVSSTASSNNGDSLRMLFSPQDDTASGTVTSSYFPRTGYAFYLVRAKAATVVNVATRGTITPTQSLTAGFVVTGGSKTVLIRAVGPALAGFGVVGANADTRLTLYSGSAIIAANDNWGDNPNASAIPGATTQVGAFALTVGSRDAAVLVTLMPGAYTASATSVGNASGDALIEVYEVTK